MHYWTKQVAKGEMCGKIYTSKNVFKFSITSRQLHKRRKYFFLHLQIWRVTRHLNKREICMALLRHISFCVVIPFIYLGCWPRQEYCFYFIISRQKARELCARFQLLIQFESLWESSKSVPDHLSKILYFQGVWNSIRKGTRVVYQTAASRW